MGMDISALTGGGAASLNDEMLAKLRAEDEKVTVAPAENRLEEWEKSSEAYDRIKAQVTALESSLYAFSQENLNNNVFDAISISVSGDAAAFDATGSLEEGTHDIDITALAKRDVWQSDSAVSSADALVGEGTFSITIDGVQHDFTTTATTTYSELANDISNNANFNATVSQVSDSDFRLVVKSADTGISNTLTIAEDLSGIAVTTHSQTASNLIATVDGVAYNTSSNTVSIGNTLSMTAVKTGTSSINLQSNPNAVLDAINSFVDAFNTLTETVNNESRYNADTEEAGALQNASQIRNMLSAVKEKLFGSYGDDTGDKHNVFGFGFELDRQGKLTVDQDALSSKISTSPEDVKELFVGDAANKGMMEQLHEYIGGLDASNGLLSLYEKNMASDHESLKETKEKAIADLDAKYGLMKTQFARYSVIISQMESSFSSLKYQIAEATASKN